MAVRIVPLVKEDEVERLAHETATFAEMLSKALQDRHGAAKTDATYRHQIVAAATGAYVGGRLRQGGAK